VFAAPPAAPAAPAAAGHGTTRPLVVALAQSPPFAIKADDGTWSGLSVDLWREVAAQLDVRWEPREVALEQVESLLHDGSVDVALGAIAVDADGESRHDYSQPFYAAGLGFAERSHDQVSWRATMAALSSYDFLRLVALIAGAILAVGISIAFIERRRDASEFGGPLQHGIATGIWWAAVTMTTVGYGDTTPKTAPGRSLALVWMFVGVAAVAVFTATVTSILTVGSLHASIRHAAELAHLRLGTVSGSAGAHYLSRRHVSFTPFDSYEASFAALAANRIDAVVANAPALRYLARRQWQGVIRVSPIALLSIVEQDRWRDVEHSYFGHA
jgi:ABC-type amino acid transport substrate-binding protein